MEVMFNNHITISSVLNLDTSTFVHVVSTLESGLKGLDTGISTQVCRYGSFTTFVCLKLVSHSFCCNESLFSTSLIRRIVMFHYGSALLLLIAWQLSILTI